LNPSDEKRSGLENFLIKYFIQVLAGASPSIKRHFQTVVFYLIGNSVIYGHVIIIALSMKDVNVQFRVDVFGVIRRVINQFTQLDYVHLLSAGKVVKCQV